MEDFDEQSLYPGRLLFERNLILGGHRVNDAVPESYSGPCRVTGGHGETICFAKDRQVGLSIAAYAISPDGGYGAEATVSPAPTAEPVFNCLEDFICE